jgi:hypothetical protein
MKIMSSWFRKQMAGSLVILLAAPFVDAATPQQQLASASQQAQSTTVSQNQAIVDETIAATPESGMSAARPVDTGDPAPAISQTPTQQGTQPASDQQQTPPQKPVGTAAAPDEKPVGVAASRPAGAVIAPAKQKRARIFLIRTAIIVGGAVAVGTVIGLSKGSPSRPN